jgi:hypothetical protein
MITSPLHRFLCVVLFVLIELPAHSCGPDWAEAVFVKKHGPDLPYDAFARGRLGVAQPGYRTRHLVITYRYLNHLPLSLDEQQDAVNANNRFNSTWSNDQQSPLSQHKGFLAWIEARKEVGPVDGFVPQSPFSTEGAWQFDSYFENCLDDAFANAARTLQVRQSTLGNRPADVIEWVRGQDVVFQNCDKQTATPIALSASAVQWLRYDRAYQQAAALLYQRKYEDAVSAFSAIATDSGSPWSQLSQYLVGRVMVSQAVALEEYDPPPGSDTSKEQSPDQYLEQLRSARAKLLTMRAEPRMRSLEHAVNAMLDRVNARLEPELQTRTLAVRLTAPEPDPNFYQDVLDLSYLLSDETNVDAIALANRAKTSVPGPANAAERRAADMLAWMKVFHTSDENASLEHWHASHEDAWLLNALSFAKPEGASTRELLQAAATVGQSNPAYTAVTYHRFRLSPVTALNRGELLTVLPHLSASESVSTLNLFAELNARSAPDLNTWLKEAARKPAAEAMYSEEEPFDTKMTPQPCGPSEIAAETPLFPPDAATVLNTRLPLRLLAQAAESTSLPPNLRFQVAQAAWTRAVLLDRRDIAARLSPILIQCNSNWQPVLSAYDRAKSTKDQKATALFALMRFASTEPDVREGNYRIDGFASYSYYRDNWWCFTVPPNARNQNSGKNQYADETGWGFTSVAHTDVVDPLFLTQTDRVEAFREIAILRAIPRASEYLASEAASWQRAHPHDSRAPELLGEAFRVVRNACGDKTSADTEHQLFLTLHREYPTNHWTLRYQSWE